MLGCFGLMGSMVWPAMAQAQEAIPAEYKISHERRVELYEMARIEPRVAVRRSLLLPGLGNIYADRVFKGMMFMGGAGMSLALGLGGLLREDPIFTMGGGISLAAIYTAATVSSYYDALAYNASLRERYKVKVSVGPVLHTEHQGAMLTVRW